MDAIYALPGDVFFTRSTSLLGRAIQLAQSDPDEKDGAWANHTGLVVAPGWIVPPMRQFRFSQATVIESLWKTQRWLWWENHQKEYGNEIRVYRRPDLTLEQFRAIEQKANQFVGRTYGWWKLFAHLADRLLFKGHKTISTLLVLEERPICSYTTAKSFAAADIHFGVPAQGADPDEMLDYCENAAEWKLVGGSKIEGVK